MQMYIIYNLIVLYKVMQYYCSPKSFGVMGWDWEQVGWGMHVD